MNLNFSVGRHNTGCENKLKNTINRVMGGVWPEKEIPGIVGNAILIMHMEQPKFSTLRVFFDLEVIPDLAGPRGTNYTMAFDATMDEIRTMGDAAFAEMVKFRIEQCKAELIECLKVEPQRRLKGEEASNEGKATNQGLGPNPIRAQAVPEVPFPPL